MRGDPPAPGREGRKLPAIGGYWPDLRLVVEYRGPHYDRPERHYANRATVSGVERDEQRVIYAAQRDELIPQHGLRLVVIRSADLDADARGRLHRNRASDLEAVRRFLHGHL
ncbi:hypothetical protein GCM10007079_22310 [Nocardiopsis terrae]|uniref:Uncharacterized protein n=1 Tax=Nocardiopsis terrae TaxID=372655 RepID=A0ABR9HGK4_9ACTN|nr:hypothetical protein [Nocardiopsis terrae]MBE1458157.1 hypothetical protein [Nocardiopsis terrae]GHC81867.1 hypothetical protein GCM10007079_22310 [Nocardiopsis terrae]